MISISSPVKRKAIICTNCLLPSLNFGHGLCRKCYHEQWQYLHPDKTKEYQARYGERHRDRRLTSSRLWKQRNPEKIKQYKVTHRALSALWKRLHRWSDIKKTRLKERIQRQIRKARNLLVPSSLTPEQWIAIKLVYKNKCAYCGKKTNRLTQDHVIPVSKGGGYTSSNIVPSCPSCNSSKRDREPNILPARRLML